MKMKIIIEIEGNTQPELIHNLDEARKQLLQGGCYMNVGGCTNVFMRPADEATKDEFRQQYEDANPRPKPLAAWIRT